ncbi:mercury resistance protein, partial [Vibrio cholerae]|nr:mercury resistance protein [Vibrio cholerae]
MRNAAPDESTKGSRWRAYAWGVLAALTCPCHLPLLVIA